MGRNGPRPSPGLRRLAVAKLKLDSLEIVAKLKPRTANDGTIQ